MSKSQRALLTRIRDQLQRLPVGVQHPDFPAAIILKQLPIAIRIHRASPHRLRGIDIRAVPYPFVAGIVPGVITHQHQLPSRLLRQSPRHGGPGRGEGRVRHAAGL